MKILYSIYAWIVGGLLFIFNMTMVIILKPFFKVEKIFNFIRFSFKLMLNLILLRAKVIYEETIDKNKTYIFMPNHVSLLDAVFATAYAPVFYNAIEAKSHFSWILYGKGIKILGQIPIDRKNLNSSLQSFELAKEKIQNGRSIIVFPEGTRSRNGKIGKFKSMPFKFAKESNADIVPVAFVGNEKLVPEDSLVIAPTKIKIVFGKQIKNSEIKNLTTQELKDKVKNQIIEMKQKYKDKK